MLPLRSLAPAIGFGFFFLGCLSPLLARQPVEPLIIAAPQSNSVFCKLALPASAMEGFDVELLESAGSLIYRDVQFLPARTPEQALNMLHTGRADAVAAIPMAHQLQGTDTLLIPYRQEWVHAYVRRDSLYRRGSDLAKATLAMPAFSPALNYARSRGWQVDVTKTYADAFQQLKAERVDAVLADPSVAQSFLAEGATIRFRRLPEPVLSAEIALAVRADQAGNEPLIGALTTLNEIGQKDRLEASWGVRSAEPISPPTHFLLLGYGGLILVAALLILTRRSPSRTRHAWVGIATQPAFPGRHS